MIKYYNLEELKEMAANLPDLYRDERTGRPTTRWPLEIAFEYKVMVDVLGEKCLALQKEIEDLKMQRDLRYYEDGERRLGNIL